MLEVTLPRVCSRAPEGTGREAGLRVRSACVAHRVELKPGLQLPWQLAVFLPSPRCQFEFV